MALLIGDNFNYQGQKPNFERDSFDTLESMISYPETSIDDGHISYCKETKKHYIYNSSNESTDTGKWKELSNSSEAYVIDYLTGNTGDITQVQYNEIQQAINDYRSIILVDGDRQYTVDNYGINESNIDLVLQDASTTINIIINEDLTYQIQYIFLQLIYELTLANWPSSGKITSQQFSDLKRAVSNSYTIVIKHESMRDYQFCTAMEIESSSDNICLQTADADSSTRIIIKSDLTYTIEESTGYESLAGEEGQVLTKTSDGAAWQNIPNTSGPIKDFNDAPEVVKNTFAATMVGTAHIDNYTELEEAVGDTTTAYLYNSASSGSEGFSNFYITVGHYNEHILYTIFSPLMPGTYFANMYGYIAIDSAGNVERHDYTNLIQVTTDGISIHATGSAQADDRDITLKTEGTGDQFLADNGQYKAIDTSSSSVILPFEKAPEVFQKFIRDGLSHVGETYIIDYVDNLFSALTNLDGTVYFYSDGGIIAGYIYVSYTSSECGAMLDIPCYSNYYHLRVLMTADTSGNVESQSATNALIMAENKIRLFCAINDQTDTISLDTTGDGNKYLGDDGEYHEIKQVSSYGTSAERPSNTSIGFQYFDTDLNRPIWWNGTKWVGATDANIVKLTQAQYEELPTKDPDTIYFIKG